MINNPLLAPAYVLHTRLYRDTSLLVEFFSREHGCFTAVAKGARTQRSPWRGILMPGLPLLVSCVGRHELLTLTHAEIDSAPISLQGKALFSLFYLNELLSYLLPRSDPHSDLYDHYAHTLKQLEKNQQLEIVLRLFEWNLLQHLGYGLELHKLVDSDLPIDTQAAYQLDLNIGLVAKHAQANPSKMIYSGKTLQALALQQLSNEPQLLREAKHLTRQLLQSLLGDKDIVSRRLFS